MGEHTDTGTGRSRGRGNSLDGINEPECMRDSLIARGGPSEAIMLDVKDLQAFNARSPFSEMAVMIYVREYFARVKMFWDLWTSDETSDTHK